MLNVGCTFDTVLTSNLQFTKTHTYQLHQLAGSAGQLACQQPHQDRLMWPPMRIAP